ncbi:hypothetical protein J8L98_01410 [Pseudoalteromonas sp. MMG013]|uniref:hypothetical protein n=1 Tax=Pseudoalteromonas sp. MMG013 TaxID=2822687 RepID=UPI001B39792E|nr:hypothetical protein [Pseudoalteromonas sp. MMG013]MBQ4860346.1 hypothetical protein [Pseudoalteromonas sp. MMG013]
MLIRKTVKAGDVVVDHVRGSNIAIIRASAELKVVARNVEGKPIIDTEMFQGMNLQKLNYASVQIKTEVDQEIEYWLGFYPYSYETQSDRPSSIVSRQIPLKSGVHKLLRYDPPRVRTFINSPVDIYIGGKDLKSSDGVVENGRLFKKDKEIELSNFGDIYYWVSDMNNRVFYSQTEPMIASKYVTETSPTQSYLISKGIPFVNVDVPQALANKVFDLNVEIIHNSEGLNAGFKPAIFYTKNGADSNELTRYIPYGMGGIGNGVSIQKHTIQVTMPAGLNRLFFAETTLHSNAIAQGHTNYGESFTYLQKVSTKDPELLVLGISQILEERT